MPTRLVPLPGTGTDTSLLARVQHLEKSPYGREQSRIAGKAFKACKEKMSDAHAVLSCQASELSSTTIDERARKW